MKPKTLSHPWRGACAAALAAGLLMGAGPAAAQASSKGYAGRPGPYVLAAAGGTQYELDCIGYYYNAVDSCSYARSSAGKVALGYRFNSVFGVEGQYVHHGRGRIDNERTPRDVVQVSALGVNATFGLVFSPGTEGLLRVGLADVRHERSDDTGARNIFTVTAGLGLLLHLGPQAALEVGLDFVGSEGRQTGNTAAGTLTVGLRLAF